MQFTRRGKRGEGEGRGGPGELFGFQLNTSECEQEPKALEELTSLIFQVTTGFR